MKTRIGVVVCAFGLASCTTLGTGKISEAIPTSDIVKQVQCELASLYAAGEGHGAAFSSWVAGIDLTLKLTDTVSQAPSTLTVAPPMTGASMTVPMGGSAEDKRIGTRSVRYDVAISDLAPSAEVGSKLQSICASQAHLVANGLGLSEWLNQVADAADQGAAQLSSLTFDIQFTVTRGVSGGLTFKTVPVAIVDLKLDGPKVSAIHDNRLIVTFKNDPSRADEPLDRTSIPESIRQELQDSLDEIIKPDNEGATIQLVPGQTIIIQ